MRRRAEARDVLAQNRDEVVIVGDRSPGELELAARLDRQLRRAARQRDRVAALEHRRPAVRREPRHHGRDPAIANVRRRGAGRRIDADQLELAADPPLRDRLGGVGEIRA